MHSLKLLLTNHEEGAHLKTYILKSQILRLDIWLDVQIGHLHTRMMRRMNTQTHDHLWNTEQHVTSQPVRSNLYT